MSDDLASASTAAPAPAAQPAPEVTNAAPPPPANPDGHGQIPEGNAKPTAPQEITYSLKSPEGMKVSEQGINHVLELAKAHGWDNDTAQDYLNSVAEQSRASVQRSLDAYQAQRKEWRASIQSDPELGGQNFERTVHRCGKLMQKIDPKGELRTFMNTSGIGDHPVVVRAFEQIARYLVPDDFVTGGSQSMAPKPISQRMGFNFKPLFSAGDKT